MQHIPRKRFGQNFLIDPYIIANIVAEINPQKDDRMIEIGPGLGALTNPLLQRLNHLSVIEIDRDIVARLKTLFSPDKLTIYAIDALKFDFSSLGSQLRTVGNLPYNISTPLLFHLSQYSENILDMHFMLQKEVVQRLTAKPGVSDYSRLSVMMQYHFNMTHVFNVPPQSFSPAPKVDSAIIEMIPRPRKNKNAHNELLFSQIVLAAFSQRRKTLRNTLQQYLAANDFNKIGIDSRMRAENLSVENFVTITNLCYSRK
ncbi:dimethyladenosine transferase [Nitrosomonas sp. PY1]|uniref:16S rRNA (adenine(1518)-N(6)/adenine(1519)-N(6))- dimethyltransferase RsmA n=1 Tax=Nitrosomonas sp. PY1 TaxID=1803906 RepID=UPI001FC7F5DE|nr:16S rRNA (adenine(1518)-N(6)/adenine(1519)-N(6))-dimethyltransferase RsmA [Nitrosomonas sp. PY1]GKS69830.1 dimethyladenosine transferase [Nitrosomonas sp. PY1]